MSEGLDERQIAAEWDKARLEERDEGRAYDGAFDFTLYPNHLARFARRIAARIVAAKDAEWREERESLAGQVAMWREDCKKATARAERAEREHAQTINRALRLEDQLAEVTKEREGLIAEASSLHTERNALRAQLATAKREALTHCANELFAQERMWSATPPETVTSSVPQVSGVMLSHARWFIAQALETMLNNVDGEPRSSMYVYDLLKKAEASLDIP